MFAILKRNKNKMTREKNKENFEEEKNRKI